MRGKGPQLKRKRTQTNWAKPSMDEKIAAEVERAKWNMVETKSYDTYDSINVDADGIERSLFYNQGPTPSSTSIVQGINVSSYLGDTIRPSYCIVRGVVTRGDSSNVVRIFAIQVHGITAPSVTSIMQFSTSGTLAGTVRVFSAFNRAYNDQYTVLADRIMAVSESGGDLAKFKFKIPGSRLRQVSFADASGTVSDGDIRLYFLSDSSITPYPYVRFYSRVSYKDA